MKTVVIGMPEALPPELASNPDVLVVDPAMLPEEVLMALNEATGGMLGEEGDESGEGALTDWAGEEEREHGMGGRGDEDEPEGGEGDEEEKDPLGGEGEDEDGAMSGEGDDEEEKEKGGSRGRGGRAAPPRRFDMNISGRGAAVPPLTAWAKAMGRGGR